MKPTVRRMQSMSLSNTSWFPPLLKECIQNSMAHACNMKLPGQNMSAAELAAGLLVREFGAAALSSHTIVDFCAGGGSMAPAIEDAVNGFLGAEGLQPVDFVRKNLRPPGVQAVETSASSTPWRRRMPGRGNGNKVMRLFNLAFHHLDDEAARGAIRDCIECGAGFVILELQDRTLESFVADTLLPLGVVLVAPYYAWQWSMPALFVFTWLLPVIPLVLIWDGYASSLRTREPEEVEELVSSCGADASQWVLRSGSELRLWPFGYLNWIICRPVVEL
ncbi:hypothetical protein B0I35DRAFT_437114 [Stachybotrys elegans]|uniref:Methyltransferase domain-containing protein n=1 Tax=Stachybotrys elegans TaxID=80388 RepID=A0A8K0WP62_9HYPO|nr:hypothetical protein B0I35DRAFT_437114 [Stachybotrys elegans]